MTDAARGGRVWTLARLGEIEGAVELQSLSELIDPQSSTQSAANTPIVPRCALRLWTISKLQEPAWDDPRTTASKVVRTQSERPGRQRRNSL